MLPLFQNPTGDNIFTLLISSHTCGSFDNVQILFNMLCKKRDSMEKLNLWLIRIIEELSKANSCDLGAKEMRRVIDLLLKSAVAYKEEKDAEKHNNEAIEPVKDFKKRIIKNFLQKIRHYKVKLSSSVTAAYFQEFGNNFNCLTITH